MRTIGARLSAALSTDAPPSRRSLSRRPLGTTSAGRLLPMLPAGPLLIMLPAGALLRMLAAGRLLPMLAAGRLLTMLPAGALLPMPLACRRPRGPLHARGLWVARSYVHEARKRVGPKRERIRPIIERLAAEHPDAVIALRFRDELELLVSVMLSAQTTDVNVNRVTERLFEKYRHPEDYVAVPIEELQRDIFATGTYRQKARNLRGTMQTLIEEFDGRVPTRIDDLVRLPGVGRKTANVVASERGATQGIVVDTHVRRLSQRLGLTRQEDPAKIERNLQRIVPRRDWARFPHLLIWHGRRVCIARRPRCEDCVLVDLCPSSRV